MTENRIEPWEEPSETVFANPLDRRTKGTRVHWDGTVLRARGTYSRDLAVALIHGYRRHRSVHQ